MNHSDIAALMKGVAPVIRDLVAAATKPLVEEIATLKIEIGELRQIDHVATVADLVADAVGKIELPAAGKDGAPGRDGSDGKDGADGAVDMTEVAALIAAAVAEHLTANPPPAGKDGRDGAPGEPGQKGDPGQDGKDGRDGVDGQQGRDGVDGKDGAPGKLPVARAWADQVYRDGDVTTHRGALWQATRDTGKEPPHADWICLAERGADGASATEIEVRGTFDPEASYGRLNIVALNGAAFIARTDDPGPCPGENWQVIAMRGKPGPPGEAKRGDPGTRGLPGPAVRSLDIDGQGLLTLTNADGSTAVCDMYPLLSKLGGK